MKRIAFIILLLAGPAAAQSDVPDRFRIEAGGFRIGSSTELTFNTTGGSKTPVDFESNNLPENANRFYIEGFWRPWRRHQFSLSWYRNNREGDPRTTDRSFTWGSVPIPAGVSVAPRAHSSFLSGAYRFAAYKNDTFEIGPAIGIGHLSLEAGLRGEIRLGNQSQSFDIAKDSGNITGDLGGYLYWWPARRLLVRGDFRYILVKPERSEASVTDGRAALVYHFVKNFGVGLQYVYSKFRYDREIVSTELGGTLRYSGGQLVISGAF